jgi:hypothetical protein
MSVLTREIIETLDETTIKAIGKAPQYKALSLAILTERKEAKNAEFVAYRDNYLSGGLFTIGGQEVSIAQVIEFALTSMTYRESNEKYEEHKAKFPKVYARAGEAWTVLDNIQKGFIAKGEKFSKATEDLRAIVEASL